MEAKKPKHGRSGVSTYGHESRLWLQIKFSRLIYGSFFIGLRPRGIKIIKPNKLTSSRGGEEKNLACVLTDAAATINLQVICCRHLSPNPCRYSQSLKDPIFDFLIVTGKANYSQVLDIVQGLVDTGADVTVIRDPEWPDRCGFWPGVCDRH
ncbi:unnamed protein product [Caretta caretta]